MSDPPVCDCGEGGVCDWTDMAELATKKVYGTVYQCPECERRVIVPSDS